MYSFRKLSEAEIPAKVSTRSVRAQVAQAYDALLADFALGEYGRAELVDGERRNGIRSRLHAAARRRGLALRFRPGPGPLIFCVEAVPVVEAACAVAPAQRVIPPRRRHEGRKPAGRYDAGLPRWMREGQRTGQGDGKRRQGR